MNLNDSLNIIRMEIVVMQETPVFEIQIDPVVSGGFTNYLLVFIHIR